MRKHGKDKAQTSGGGESTSETKTRINRTKTKVMTKEELIQKQIEDIMDEFNFGEVQRVMESLDWTWSETGCVPEEYDLRKGARKLLKEAAKMIDDSLDMSGGSTSTGGFLAASRAGCYHYDGGHDKWLRLDLHFCVDSVTLDGESFD